MKQASVMYLRSMSHYNRTGLGDPTMIYVEDDQMMRAVGHICCGSYKHPDTIEWIDNDTVRMCWKYDTTEGYGPIVPPENGVMFGQPHP